MVALNDIFTLPLLALSAAAGILDPSRPDSKIARNVLEGKAEGYCSVSTSNRVRWSQLAERGQRGVRNRASRHSTDS